MRQWETYPRVPEKPRLWTLLVDNAGVGSKPSTRVEFTYRMSEIDRLYASALVVQRSWQRVYYASLVNRGVARSTINRCRAIVGPPQKSC